MPRGAKPKSYPLQLVEDVRRLYEHGQTQQEIADATGLTQKGRFQYHAPAQHKRTGSSKKNQWGEKQSCMEGQ
jgi:hypothetical protein